MQNVKSISLLCENLAEIELLPHDVDVFHIGGLSAEIQKIDDEFLPIDVCDRVVMVIKREANQVLEAPFGEYGSLFNMLNTDHCISAVSVLCGEDGCEEETAVYVPWEGELENACMDTRITEDGDLLLVISEDDTVETVFGCGDCGCCHH